MCVYSELGGGTRCLKGVAIRTNLKLGAGDGLKSKINIFKGLEGVDNIRYCNTQTYTWRCQVDFNPQPPFPTPMPMVISLNPLCP